MQRENQTLVHGSECTAGGEEFVCEPQNGGEKDRSEEMSCCERLRALLRMCGYAVTLAVLDGVGKCFRLFVIAFLRKLKK